MKRALTLIILLILSYAVVVSGRIQEIEAIWYSGLVFGCAVVLVIILALFKMMCRFMSRSLTSMLFTFTALAIVGVLSWFGKINAFVGYATGMVFGIAFFWVFFRKLAGWAQRSMLFGEVFQFTSGYKIRSYLTKETLVPKEVAMTLNVDFKNITLLLREQMGYPATEAKEAAAYAIEETSADATIEEKVKAALKYMDGEHVVEIDKARSN